MGKHNKAKLEKQLRNALYADKYRHRKCRTCGHKSSVRGKCALCGGEMK